MGDPRLIVPTVRSSANEGESLNLRCIAVDRQPVRKVELRWRSLGHGEYHVKEAKASGRSVFDVSVANRSRGC